jgi:hypothetical protein
VLALGPDALRRYLWQELPSRPPATQHEHHEAAWALAEEFDAAGRPEEAALCRSSTTHEILSVWRWTQSFPEVPAAFWGPALAGLGPRPGAPARVALSLAVVRALLDAVGDGLTLTPGGGLPHKTVLALDDRFRWTEEFPWMRPDVEADIPPLRFLHEHLTAQRLLVRDGLRLTVGEAGRLARGDDALLWRAVVDPRPRWAREFELDTLGVLAAELLRTGTFTPGRTTEEITPVLAAKWRPGGGGSVYDGASLVVQGWYQLGVPLGWWDTGRGPADRRPNAFGAAAARAVFRAPGGPRARDDGRPA